MSHQWPTILSSVVVKTGQTGKIRPGPAYKKDIAPSQAWKELEVSEVTTGTINCMRNHLNVMFVCLFLNLCFTSQVHAFQATLLETAPFPRQCYKWVLLICPAHFHTSQPIFLESIVWRYTQHSLWLFLRLHCPSLSLHGYLHRNLKRNKTAHEQSWKTRAEPVTDQNLRLSYRKTWHIS